MTGMIRAVLTGKIAALGPRGVPSGIAKQAAPGPIAVQRTGLAGDEQGDTKHHGGPDKAIHHYPFDHYGLWRAECPALTPRLAAEGAFGENISTIGMTEANVCIGDVYRLGTALVQVSQGRQPCWKLNERFNEPAMARRVQQTGRTGWYYRVLEEGQVGASGEILLVDRPAADWTLERITHVLYRDTLNVDDLAALAGLPELTESWRRLARRRLESNAVEDWSRRLNAPRQAAP